VFLDWEKDNREMRWMNSREYRENCGVVYFKG